MATFLSLCPLKAKQQKHKLKIQIFRLCGNKTLLNRDQFRYQRERLCLSPSLHAVRTTHTSGLTHHTLVSCEAFTNAQFHTSASVRGETKTTKDLRASIVRILCSNIHTQIYSTKKQKQNYRFRWNSWKRADEKDVRDRVPLYRNAIIRSSS